MLARIGNMSANTYTQLSILGIILGSFLFFSNYQSSDAPELFTPEDADTSDETLDIILPLPTPFGREQQEEDDSSIITSNTIQEGRQEEQNDDQDANDVKGGKQGNNIGFRWIYHFLNAKAD
jgi:hypothetical protein